MVRVPSFDGAIVAYPALGNDPSNNEGTRREILAAHLPRLCVRNNRDHPATSASPADAPVFFWMKLFPFDISLRPIPAGLGGQLHNMSTTDSDKLVSIIQLSETLAPLL
jgi:hypothetical protein